MNKLNLVAVGSTGKISLDGTSLDLNDAYARVKKVFGLDLCNI